MSFDANFSFLPNLYYQLLSMYFLKYHHIFPVAFSAFKNKNLDTFSRIFRILKQLLPRLKPRVIKFDFEMAFIRALRLLFLNL